MAEGGSSREVRISFLGLLRNVNFRKTIVGKLTQIASISLLDCCSAVYLNVFTHLWTGTACNTGYNCVKQ